MLQGKTIARRAAATKGPCKLDIQLPADAMVKRPEIEGLLKPNPVMRKPAIQLIDAIFERPLKQDLLKSKPASQFPLDAIVERPLKQASLKPKPVTKKSAIQPPADAMVEITVKEKLLKPKITRKPAVQSPPGAMVEIPLKEELQKSKPAIRKPAILLSCDAMVETPFKEELLKPKDVMRKPAIQLPYHVMVEIILRLPAKSLSRMRSVCKSWHSLLDEDWFALQQMKIKANKKNVGFIRLHYTPWEFWGDLSLDYFEGGCLQDRFNLSDVAVDPRYSMTNCCNGLICVFGIESTFIVNPSIKKLIALPSGSKHYDPLYLRLENVPQAGLGFDVSKGEYKVVRLFCHQDERSTGCEVFTLGGSKCHAWKVIGDAPLSPDYFSPDYFSLPVVVNGAIHWAAGNFSAVVSPEVVLSFNINEEAFGVFLHPGGSSRPDFSHIAELDGYLCISDTKPTALEMDIWVLKDYRNQKWIKQYSVDLTSARDWITGWGCWVAPMTMWNEKIVLSDDRGKVYLYDPKSRSFEEPQNPANYCPDPAHYNESIVWFWTEMITIKQKERIGNLRKLKLEMAHREKGCNVW